MEHSSAPFDSMIQHQRYQQAAMALQGADFTPEQFVKMHKTRSQPSSSRQLKRKLQNSHEPRSMSTAASFAPTQMISTHDISQGTAEMMNRKHAMSVQSAPAGVATSRGVSRRSSHGTRHQVPRHSDARQNCHAMSMPLPPHNVDGTLQDPEDFFAAFDSTNSGLTHYPAIAVPEGQPMYDPNLLSASSMHAAWSPASGSSTNSPIFDNVNPSPVFMSRDPTRSSFSSYGYAEPCCPEDVPDLSMLRMQSQLSHISQSDSPFQLSQHQAPLGAQHHFHDSSPATSFVNTHTSFETSSFPQSDDFLSQSYVAPHMQRSQSSSSSNASNVSRSQKRHLETIQQSRRSLAPALSQNQNLSSSFKKEQLQHPAHQSVRMERVISETGEEKEYAVIPKEAERQRKPVPQKLYCEHCTYHPDGFRGEHELQRHINRAHAKTRKVWICIDASDDGKFLANCKACRTRKRYGAYYNAAAHLRRTHFNPRKRGRRSKGEEHEKRGGKGGGNWPPMADLKASWIREIEEEVNEDTLPLDDADAEEEELESEETSSTIAECGRLPRSDPNALNFAGTGFNDSTMSSYAMMDGSSIMPLSTADFDPMMSFDNDMLMQGAFASEHDMFFDGGNGFASQMPPVVGYDGGAQMWAMQA